MSVVALKPRREDAPDQPPAPVMLSPRPSEDPHSRRLAVALALSIVVHAFILALFMFIPQQKPVAEKQPEIVVLELAALGKPEAEEEKPAPPPPPPEQKAPEAPPAVEQKPPEPQPLPEIAPPPVPETPPAPQAEAVPAPPKVTARPVPKPEIAPPPAPKEPEPKPEAPPVAAAPSPPAETQQRPLPPAPSPSPAPPAQKPGKGIETGVEGGTSQAEMNRYVTTLFTMIDAKKVYPPQSLQRREQGTVVVKLEIAADGKLVDASSPTDDPKRLVDASLEAVRKAAPFPPLPASLKQAEAEFQVPVVYKLQ